MLQGAELHKLVSGYITICEKRGLSPRTVGNKRDIFRTLLRWLGTRPLSKDTLQEYVYELDKRMAPSSRNTNLRYIKAFIQYLFEQGVIGENWSKRVDYIKEKKKKYDVVRQEVMEQIIIEGCRPGPGDNSINRKIKKSMELAMRFALRTGVRFNECSHIAGSDLQLDMDPPTAWIMAAKGGDNEAVPFPKDMLNDLKDRMGDRRVFPIYDKTCNLAIKRGMERLGITNKRLTFHSLRHIFATSLLIKGVSLQQVSRLLRHSDIQITHDIYSHYDISDLAVIVNSKQALVRLAITPEEVIDEFMEQVKRFGLDSDKRFNPVYTKGQRKLTIEVTW